MYYQSQVHLQLHLDFVFDFQINAVSKILQVFSLDNYKNRGVLSCYLKILYNFLPVERNKYSV
jgi:hypothetical protein